MWVMGRSGRMALSLLALLGLTGGQFLDKCTKDEAAKTQLAFNQLAKCTSVGPEDLTKAMIDDSKNGGILGGLALDDVADCLDQIKSNVKNDPRCFIYLKELNIRANRKDGSVGSVVAHKLMYDPKEFCECTMGIDTSGVLCSGYGVSPLVKKLKNICKDLNDPKMRAVIADPMAPKGPARRKRRLAAGGPTANFDQISKCFATLQQECQEIPQNKMLKCATDAIRRRKMDEGCLYSLFGDVSSGVGGEATNPLGGGGGGETESEAVKAQEQGGEYQGEQEQEGEYGSAVQEGEKGGVVEQEELEGGGEDDYNPDDALQIFSPAEKSCVNALVNKCENAGSDDMIDLCINQALERTNLASPLCAIFAY